jgi:Mo-dependent nitrogenase C-terminus
MSTLILKNRNLSLVQALKQWIDRLEIHEERSARRIIKLIPAQCPFAREICLFNRVILRIPALCKFNPLYEQLIALRFRALCFLVEQCGEDITPYCTRTL